MCVCVLILLHVSSYLCICVLILLYVCPHTTKASCRRPPPSIALTKPPGTALTKLSLLQATSS
jgi:hypothetical protein